MRWTLKLAALLVALMMVSVTFQSAIAEMYEDDDDGSRAESREEIPGPFRDLDKLVAALMAATPLNKRTDSDNDTIYDQVEWVIGTDPYNADSDFDLVTDMEEVQNRTDPMTPDSNGDGIIDAYEARDNVTDLDGDGVPNAWDSDNDGDGVIDSRDICPFATTSIEESFHFDIGAGTSATTIYFQLRTSNPDHMRLMHQVWDWPEDVSGRMRDMDNSIEDVTILPILELSGDDMPDDLELSEYGVVTTEEMAYIPLFPIWQYGNVIALQGQMFYPASEEPQNLSFDMTLKWRVSGQTDRQVTAFKVDDRDYLSLGDDGHAYANATTVQDAELFQVLNVEAGRVAIKAANGRLFSVRADGSVTASSFELDQNETFDQKGTDKVSFKAANGKYLVVADDGTIKADALTIDTASKFEPTAMGYRPESTILAVYPDRFSLTGCIIEESHGTDVAVVYDTEDSWKAICTNLFLTYEFMRNSTATVMDIPQMLNDNELDMEVVVRSFERMDLAMKALVQELTVSAKDEFPENKTLPIITAMMQRYSHADLSTMVNDSYILGKTLQVDVSAQPIITRKILKMNWYNHSQATPVEIEEVVEGMMEWDLEDEDLSALIALVVSWNVGEQLVVKVGSATYNPDTVFALDIVETAISGFNLGMNLFDGFFNLIISVRVVYEIATLFLKNVFNFLIDYAIEGPIWAIKAIWNGCKVAKSTYDSVGSIQKGFMGVINAFNKACKWLAVIGFVIDIGLAIVTLVTVGFANDWSAIGTFSAILYGIMMAAWATFLFVLTLLSFIPKVGIIFAIITVIITVVDLLGYLIWGKSTSQTLMDWIVDIVTKVQTLTAVDMEVLNSDMDIDDKDGNCIDAGDRITYRTIVLTQVSRTEHGDYQDVLDSYIVPSLWISVPYQSNSLVDYDSSHYELQSDRNTFIKHVYSLEGWVEPGMGMINFPYTIRMKGDYRIQYEECWWLLGWHCDRKNITDSLWTDPTTLYFDVMPGSIEEFANWKSITALDADGDGINNTEETKTNPWRWDTDADGLGDSYELQIGTDPASSDSDQDGVNDMVEYQRRSDPHEMDTDGDGLLDYVEQGGWIISFDYEGVTFDWHINSDLLINDTDGDGLVDRLEFLTRQNPRSKDTDGDGIQDTMRDYTITEFELKRNLAPGLGYAIDVVADEEGYIYATFDTNGPGCHVAKYDPNGTLVDSLTFGGALTGPMGITIDRDGYLWICDPWGPGYTLIKGDRNGTYIDGWSWDGATWPVASPQFLAFDNDDNIYITDIEEPYVYKFDANMTYIKRFGGFAPTVGYLDRPQGIAIDDLGNVYVVDRDLDRLQVYDTNGTYIRKWGSFGTGPGLFDAPRDVAVDMNGDIIVSCDPFETETQRIQKFDRVGAYIANATLDEMGRVLHGSCYGIGLTDDTVLVADYEPGRIVELYHNLTLVPVDPVDDFPDTDGDGLLDDLEESGWEISVNTSTDYETYTVVSDPLVIDTDQDALNDTHEFELGSDPQSVDTDGDGLADDEEHRIGTNLTNWDTDGDGLEDGTELTFGSDPLVRDTDGEGLSDYREFMSGSDPNLKDTDSDGLDDLHEFEFRSSLIDPDSDNDLMFDSREFEIGSLPNQTDSDVDGLMDGYEDLFDTNATNGDTDGDGLPDGLEVSMHINPLSNDTDGDGLTDSAELDLGLNPRSGDSDADGVPDKIDKDYEVSLAGTVYLVVDAESDPVSFVEKLSSMVDVTIVTPEELISDHQDARYIVLIGDPTIEESTAGAIVRSLLADSPYILERMNMSEEAHIAVRYGKWTPTQTLVMLSRTYPSDHYRVLGILKSMSVKVTDGALTYNYLAPRSCFKLDDFDTIKATDAKVWTKLDDMVVFSVDIAKYTEEDTPRRLDRDNGLPGDEMPIGKYLEIEVSENIQNEEGDLITGATIWVYYTVDDLDVNGDGDADDPVDIDETTLSLYVYHKGDGTWVKLTDELEWVDDAGVDTTDVDMYGEPYAGFLWANVTHLSLFSAGGRMNTDIVTTADPGPDLEVMEGEEVTFDGTDSEGTGGIVTYKWTFYYNWETVTLYGPDPTFTFMREGGYEVTLEVRDLYGGIGTASLMVTVKPLKILVRVGPIVDSGTRPLYGVIVQIIWGDQVLKETTGFSGFADFMIDSDAIGEDVNVMVRKKGYEPQEYQTGITADGKLQQSPEAMVAVEGPDASSAGAEGPAAWEYAFAIALLVIVFLVVLISIGKGPKLTRNKEGKSEDGEET